MWNVRSVPMGGTVADARYRDLSSPGVSARAMWEAARGLVGDDALQAAALEPVGSDVFDYPWLDTNPTIDLIEAWGGAAASAYHPADDSSLSRDEDGALVLSAAGRIEAVAWHDQTFLVVAIEQDFSAIDLWYSEEVDDAVRTRRIEERYARRSQAVLDWRLYAGTRSVAVFGTDRLVVDGTRRLRLWTDQAHGWLVGRVFRHFTRGNRAFTTDRTQQDRLRFYEAEYPNTVAACPEVGGAGIPAGRRCVVVVHGTGSCAIPTAKRLIDHGVSPPLLRFEHDTFVSSTINARELADRLLRCGPTSRVVLVCHSRGGIVGRQTAQLLTQCGVLTDVLTFGTPHEGTPLANLDPRLLGAIYVMGFTNHGGRPYADPVTSAFRYLASSRELPEGIAEMRPGRGFLRLLNEPVDQFALESWAGCYDCGPGNPVGSGAGWKRSYGRRAFDGADNDLVVPTDSARARGAGQPILRCGHFDYFEQPVVISRLVAL